MTAPFRRFRRSPAALAGAALLAFAVRTSFGEAARDLSDRNYYVRIAVALNAAALAVKAEGEYEVLGGDGRALHVIRRGEAHTVQITKGRKGGKTYRLVWDEFGPGESEQALKAAEEGRAATGLSAKVVRMTGKTKDAGKLLAVLGEFETLEKARKAGDKLKEADIDRIYEEKSVAGEGRVELRDIGGRIVASDARRLRLKPRDMEGDSLRLDELTTARPDAARTANPKEAYRGLVDLHLDEEGRVTAVNNVWIEYYLYGVVAAEMGNNASLESLKAQAVASRSETVAKIERGIGSDNPLFDFGSSFIQTYNGMKGENENVRRAVNLTRGEILVWRGKPCDAVYGHSCGGMTATSNEIWGGDPAGYSVVLEDRLSRSGPPDLSTAGAVYAWMNEPAGDFFCASGQEGFPEYARKGHRWTETFTASRLSGMFGVGRVKDIEVERRSRSGRVLAIKVTGERSVKRISRELSIRQAFGGLKSSFFTMDVEHGKGGLVSSIEIEGAGHGHGVGMCQMGAFMMGLKGYNYRQILGHYYREVKIRRLYG